MGTLDPLKPMRNPHAHYQVKYSIPLNPHDIPDCKLFTWSHLRSSLSLIFKEKTKDCHYVHSNSYAYFLPTESSNGMKRNVMQMVRDASEE